MIEVKSTRSEHRPVDPAARYALKKQDEKSKTPFVVGLLLTGLVAYLKAIFPGLASTADGGRPPEKKADAPAPDGLDLAQMQTEMVSPETTGTILGVPGARGSGRPMIELATPARFVMVQGPAWDFFPSEPILTFSSLYDDRSWAGHANDNGAARPSPSGPGTGHEPPNGVDLGGGGNAPGGSGEGVPGPGPGGSADPPCDGLPGSRCDMDGVPNYPGASDPGDPPCPGGPGSPCDVETDQESPVCGGGPASPCKTESEPTDDDDETGNRAPRHNWPVYLQDVTGCAILVIGLSDLLRHPSDSDGGALTIQNLKVSAGFLHDMDGHWEYRAEPFFTGPVTISYEISAGQAIVTQTASFSVIRSRIEGTDDDDILVGTPCSDDIEGGDGNDNIYGNGGNDVIHGGGGNDHIVGGSGNDTIFGGLGDDVIFGGAGNDFLYGGPGNDRIFGEEGDDIIFGGEGEDFLSGGPGNDIIFGGTGDDIIHGDEGNDILYGEEGNDVIYGGDGDDLIFDGPGADIVYGGPGDDIIVAAMDGDDDFYDGGDGHDRLDYTAATLGIHLDIDAGTAKSIEIGNDTITGFEEIATGAGDDVIVDGAGRHIILAGAGDDYVIASMDGADDIYDGGEGCDTLDYSAAEQCLVIDLVHGQASGIEIGTDSISGFEIVIAGGGNDHFLLGSQGAVLTGGAGENTFEFLAPPPEERRDAVTFEITDFKVGDKLKLKEFKLFEKIFDELENEFESVFGKKVDEDDFAVRTRFEMFEGQERTVIEADFNRDDSFETTIYLQGRHVLVIVDHA